jgi:phosphoribosylaminoimidazolecarboxamide formyltransferase / IMP cyclohydrolase
MEIPLKYGCNPHQKVAKMTYEGDGAPLKVLNGNPGYINLLDLFGAWQLARELKESTGKPGAASFKHTSPAGAAIAGEMSESFRKSQMLPDEELSPVANAYVRARGGDRMCSYGDVAAVSEVVDVSLANVLKREVSDALIAPGFEPEALEILKQKQNGRFLLLEIDPDYEAPELEKREVFGFTLQQSRNQLRITREHLNNVVTQKKELPEDAALSMLVGNIALKYTQSNSVCITYQGQIIGSGAGQQSRVHCTRLACAKADKWFLQQHPKVLSLPFKEGLKRVDMTNVVDQFLLWDELTPIEREAMMSALTSIPTPLTSEERYEWINQAQGVTLCSDAFIPFRDNIDRASRSAVQYVIQTGQSLRDEGVTEAADQYGMVMVHSGVRCFLH